MMKVRKTTMWLVAVCLVLSCMLPAKALDSGRHILDPAGRRDGQPWRIVYCETEAFGNYAATLYHLVRGMEELGWISSTEGIPYQPGQRDAKVMWDWLASRDMGPYVRFLPDGFYSFQAQEEERFRVGEQLLNRLNTQGDVDLVLAMGTWPGQRLANDRHHVPVMVFSTSNAVQAAIIQSAEDSGRDHVWAHMDPNRYRRQMEVFHDVFGFRRLGMIYENSPLGRTVAGVEDVEKVAEERGFQIVARHVGDRIQQPDPAEYYRQTLAAHKELAEQVDAVYLSLYSHRNPADLPALLAPFYARKIPVFAQQWATEVKMGATLSVSGIDFNGVGQFGAAAMARILKGTPPRQVNQVFESTPHILVNMEAADWIGWKPSMEMLLAADEIYREIPGK